MFDQIVQHCDIGIRMLVNFPNEVPVGDPPREEVLRQLSNGGTVKEIVVRVQSAAR